LRRGPVQRGAASKRCGFDDNAAAPGSDEAGKGCRAGIGLIRTAGKPFIDGNSNNLL